MLFKNGLILLFVSIFLFAGVGVCSAGTFGYTWEGVGSPSSFQDQITGSLFTLSETADVQSMSAWIDFGEGTSKMKVGIYDSDDDLVAESIEYVNEAGNIDPAWYDFTFSSSIILEAGDYWLVIIADTQYVYVYKETGTTLKTYQATSTYNGLLPSYAGAVDTGDPRNIVIYATYRVPYVVVPTNFGSSALAYAGQLFTDLNLVVILVIGLPLAFWVIKGIITLPLTDKQRKAEEKEFKTVGKIIAKKDTKALDKWTKKWLREERKELKKFNKSSKSDWL